MSGTAVSSRPAVCYRPRRLKTWSASVFFILCGVLIAWPQLHLLLTARTVSARMIALLLVSFAGLALGGLGLIGTLRGLPRLSVTQGGVRLDTAVGSEWADWNSLGRFEVTSAAVIRVRSASARITGTTVNRRLRGRTRFELPDAFQTPIATIVAELNAYHPDIWEARGAMTKPLRDGHRCE